VNFFSLAVVSRPGNNSSSLCSLPAIALARPPAASPQANAGWAQAKQAGQCLCGESSSLVSIRGKGGNSTSCFSIKLT
jgi:hypothetical protein